MKSVKSMLLQIDLTTPNPNILPSDSLHLAAQNFFAAMIDDPTTFWSDMIHEGIQFGLKVLAAILIYLAGYYAIKYVRRLLEALFRSRQTEKTLASFIISLVQISLTVLLIIVTIGTLGVDTTSLAALLAAGGMAIGMALSGTVQNFAGGIMLLVFKPFRAGDRITAQGVSGVVHEVNITTTKVVTPDNRVVILPNGSLSNGVIDNYSAQVVRRIDFEVSVAYGADAAKFRETVLQMFQGDKRILDSTIKRPANRHSSGVNRHGELIPDPFVGLKSLNSSDITFAVRVWVFPENYWDVWFEYNERFYTELPKQGFHFAYPHVDVTMINTK